MYKRRRKKKNPLIKLSLITLVILLIGFWKYTSYINTPVDENDDSEVSFQVKSGERVREIADKLEEKTLFTATPPFIGT